MEEREIAFSGLGDEIRFVGLRDEGRRGEAGGGFEGEDSSEEGGLLVAESGDLFLSAEEGEGELVPGLVVEGRVSWG